MSDFVLSESLIDRIHEAALVPALWPAVLTQLSKAMGGTGGVLFAIRDGYVGAISSPNIAQAIQEFLDGGWAERDLRLRRVAALNYAGFVNDGDILTEDEIVTNEVYADFYRKHGAGYMAGTLIPNPVGDSIGFAFQRHHDDGPVSRETIVTLDRLRPHLARASMVAFRLGFERARAQADVLQALNLPGAVLRGRGRVLAANKLFETLMPAAIQDRAQRIMLADTAADLMLEEALQGLMSGTAPRVRSIPVAATEQSLPMIIHIVPIRREAHDLFTDAMALFVVTPVDRAAVPTADILQGLFDLTPAEARVAQGIVRGDTIEKLAATWGLSRETIRTQLKAAMHKTGTSRQAELVGLLSGRRFPFADR